MADTWDIVDVQPVAADAVEPPEVVSQPSLKSFLAEHGLSKHAAGIVEATGAESVADSARARQQKRGPCAQRPLSADTNMLRRLLNESLPVAF